MRTSTIQTVNRNSVVPCAEFVCSQPRELYELYVGWHYYNADVPGFMFDL